MPPAFANRARAEGKSARTRARLMDAAVAVFARKGIEAASVNEIAQAADVANGTFYNHFKDKDEIVGVVAFAIGSRLVAPAAYIVAMLAGCAFVGFGGSVPAQELAIALSLLVVGGFVMIAARPSAILAVVLMALFGVFHGGAFGGSIAGQEATAGGAVLIGYLISLGVVQYLIAVAAGAVAAALSAPARNGLAVTRLAGAGVAGLGLFLTLEHVEDAALTAFGWAA